MLVIFVTDIYFVIHLIDLFLNIAHQIWGRLHSNVIDYNYNYFWI